MNQKWKDYLIMSNLYINIKHLEELNLTIDDLIIIYKIRNYKGFIPENIPRKLAIYIRKFKDGYILRKSGETLLNSLNIDIDLKTNKIIEKELSRDIAKEVSDRIGEFREVWKGIKVGSMGDRSSCEAKLIRWRKNNPDYSFDDIINAAKAYVDSVRNTSYLQRADYFVYKQTGRKDEEESRLSAFIDEVKEAPDSNWTSNLV